MWPFQQPTITDPWNRVIKTWRRSQLAIRPGVSAEAITAFQARYRVVLPVDVRDYFLAADGTGDDMDESYNRFWPLAEMKPVHDDLADTGPFKYPDRFAYPECFMFADYSIRCWCYAVKLTADPAQPAPVFRVTGNDPAGEQMASSFREFMERYAADSFSII